MIGWNEQRAMVEEAARAFPATFGLRAFPGSTFRVSLSFSYVNDSGVVMLCTEIQKGEQWLSFAKGTASELRRELTGGSK